MLYLRLQTRCDSFATAQKQEAETAQSVQRLLAVEDIDRIVFEDGVAAVEVPVELLPHIEFKNDERGDSPRLQAVEQSIRDRGFVPTDPIIARIGAKARWVIIDGGHRLTAARHVAEEFWSNLLRRKVRTLYFLLYETERSWHKVGRPAAAGPSPFAARAPGAPLTPQRKGVA